MPQPDLPNETTKTITTDRSGSQLKTVSIFWVNVDHGLRSTSEHVTDQRWLVMATELVPNPELTPPDK